MGIYLHYFLNLQKFKFLTLINSTLRSARPLEELSLQPNLPPDFGIIGNYFEKIYIKSG